MSHKSGQNNNQRETRKQPCQAKVVVIGALVYGPEESVDGEFWSCKLMRLISDMNATAE